MREIKRKGGRGVKGEQKSQVNKVMLLGMVIGWIRFVLFSFCTLALPKPTER